MATQLLSVILSFSSLFASLPANQSAVLPALYPYAWCAEAAATAARFLLETDKQSEGSAAQENMQALKVTITIAGQAYAVTLTDNDAARALLKQLPLTVTMNDLNANEKYYYLSHSLPTDAMRPAGIFSGDLMLYGSDCLVLFYEDFSSDYSYTRLGAVDNPAGLAQALGSGAVLVSIAAN